MLADYAKFSIRWLTTSNGMNRFSMLILTALFSFHGEIQAHVIGQKSSEPGNGRSWSLTNGSVIHGIFSYANSSNVFIETDQGILRSIPLSSLKNNDQRIVSMKMEKLELLNQHHVRPVQKDWSKYLIAVNICAILFFGLKFFIRNNLRWAWASIFLLASGFGLLLGCNNDDPSGITGNPIPKTSTEFLSAAFSRFAPAVSFTWDDLYFRVSSDGIPTHGMMVGITSWQQQVPISQSYVGTNSWSIPLQPEFASVPINTRTNLMKGAVALAVNGIPIFNALNNRGEDSFAIGELDKWGGHCGKADDYHYHAAPLHLADPDPSLPIAFALDGFPVYGAKEPDGSSMTTLDSGHGHSWGKEAYHYHGTSDYPYVVGAMRGKVTLDPATPAPENQIIPQAFAKPLRPATDPLKGAVITSFLSPGERSRKLIYQIGKGTGSVEYNWDTSGKYTFIFTDTAGTSIVKSYQR